MITALVILGLVSLDFAIWSQTPMPHTRWCKLSDWRYDPDKRSTVSLVRSDNSSLTNSAPLNASLSYAQIEAMVDRAIDLAGGLAGRIPADAKTIVIKPNIVENRATPGIDGTGVNTDTRVVRAIILYLYRLNPDYRIKVAEAAGGWAEPGTPNVASWAVQNGGIATTGYKGMLDSLKADPNYPGLNVEWVDMNYDDTVTVAVPEPRISDNQKVFYLPRTLVEADFIINAPVMKVHGPGVTVGLKNWVGILPGMVYGWSHDQGYNGNGIGLNHNWTHLQKDIVELHRALPEQFVLVDATVGKEVSKYDSGVSKRRNMIIAGDDVVSVDAVCARLMDFNPDDVEHVSLAALAGLGQNDLDKIEVVGDSTETSATPFIKAQKMMGSAMHNSKYTYYGQSNRVWTVRGGFAGTDMARDYLGGETTAAPVAGKDGWSVPLYFYDDLIDPAAYCQDSTDSILYSFACLNAADSTAAQLWVGSYLKLAVWLNGQRIYNYTGNSRALQLPNSVVNVNVRKGENRILVKSLQQGGISQFSLNVCEVVTGPDTIIFNYAGNRLAGARFEAGMEEESVPGDFTGDSKVDVFDLLDILKTLGKGQQDTKYDMNSDGKVDVFDLLAILKTLSHN